jgi:glutamine amidotransferase|tara:strand:+ start:805 stop:1416 length:612 start_codon:yes stop_codon:yes gene_type:complete
MKEIAIIDYGAGNIASIVNSLEYLGRKVKILKEPSDTHYSHVILPGVGSFGKLSDNLKILNFDRYIIENLKKGSFLFGICVGMQLLFEQSEESPGKSGLGLLKGKFEKILPLKDRFLPLPHVGFSKINNYNVKIFDNMRSEAYFYFIHSYYLKKVPENVNYCTSEYGEKFVSFIEKDNIYASQFHPEKSHKTGLTLIENFLKL